MTSRITSKIGAAKVIVGIALLALAGLRINLRRPIHNSNPRIRDLRILDLQTLALRNQAQQIRVRTANPASHSN
jgi:hypothetical protein